MDNQPINVSVSLSAARLLPRSAKKFLCLYTIGISLLTNRDFPLQMSILFTTFVVDKRKRTMKYEHKIGEPFTATRKDGKQFTLVAAPSPVVEDKQWHTMCRVTCKGCVFCKARMRSCSGHRYAEETCILGGMKAAKCGAEYRADNQYIEYHMKKQ